MPLKGLMQHNAVEKSPEAEAEKNTGRDPEIAALLG
jgi:hypothetical protein